MKTRARTLTYLAALSLASGAAAQHSPSPMPGPKPLRATPARTAGTYYAATGVFARNLGPGRASAAEAIYTCNADTPYYLGINSGEVLVDDGVIPGSTSPYTAVTRDDNLVTGFDFGYCDLDTSIGSSAWEISFFESLIPCTTTVGVTPTATIQVTGVPAGGCWTLHVDLTGGQEFCIAADGGDGVFDGVPELDSFGWSLRYTGGGVVAAGPRFSSDPSATDAGYTNPNGPPTFVPSTLFPNNPPAPAPTAGSATYYNPLSGCTSVMNPSMMAAPSGSGLLNQDFYFFDDPNPVESGCFYDLGYFNLAGACGAAGGGGNNTYSAFNMRILSNGSCVDDTISSPTACLATANSTGVPGTCDARGSAVAAANDVVLRACDLPTTPNGVFGVFIHGLSDISSTPVAAGQGVICIGSPGALQDLPQIKQANAAGVVELSTSLGEFDLAALPTSNAPSTVAATAGLTSYFGFWHRDVAMPASQAFNYTGTCAVTWQ